MKAMIRKIRLPSLDGYKQHEVYNVDTFPYEYYIYNKPKLLKKWKNKKIYQYLDLVCSFDTENTTYFNEKTEKYDAFTFLWGFCIDGFLIVGRTMQEFNKFIINLHNIFNLGNKKLVIYVHNLAYDFTFIWRFMATLDPEFEVFATENRKMLTFNAYGFEFRCSYRLFNMSLAKALENEKGTIYRKAVGDFNYKKFRTPTGKDSGLTKVEWKYFCLDLIGLYDLMKNKLKNEEKTLKSIQLTSTGFVRSDLRNITIGYGTSKKTKEQLDYKRFIKKFELTPLQYTMLEYQKQGGDTHGNRSLINVLIDWINSEGVDIQSSYPTEIILSHDFEVSSYMAYGEIENEDEFYKLLKKYCCLFFIRFPYIKIKENNPFDCISVSKIINKDKEVDIIDNGRLVEGHNILLCINEIDFEVIERNYNFEGFKVSSMQVAEKGPLPKILRDGVFNYFKRKCELKLECKKHPEDENLKYLYAKYKNRINACFGMMMTNPIRPEIKLVFNPEIGDYEWKETPPDIKESLDKYYKSHKTFLHYAWGCKVTSLARRSLDNIRRAAIGKTGTAVYWDTDSCKGFNFDMNSINKFNADQRKKVIKEGYLVTIKGKEFVIGDLDIETAGNPYKKFITLGAKKYAYEDDSGLHITISGVKKKEGARELKYIERFKPDFLFKHSAGQIAYYIDEDIRNINVKGIDILTASGVALYDGTYELHAPDHWTDFTIDGGFAYG